MMKDQHKAMFRALRDGDLDSVVEEALTGRKSDTALKPVKHEEPPAPATVREAPPPLTLDLDAADQAPMSFQPQPDLPPPPENVLKSKEAGTGRYRTLEERSRKSEPPSKRGKSERPPRSRPSERPRSGTPVREERAPSPRPGAAKRDPRAEPPSEPKQPAASKQSSRPGRPQPGRGANQNARPAASFGQARPQQSSIFGEDIISDKSLDEVILSYLAEDLDEKS